MKKYIFALFLVFPLFGFSQTQSENYTKSITYKVSPLQELDGNETINPVNQIDDNDKIVNITYYDGLGRPIQQVAHRQSNSGNDIITPMEYDIFGRQAKEYLPFPSGNATMEYDPDATINVLSYGPYEGQNPYSEKRFENSPSNRVMKQGAPGNDWALNISGPDHSIKLEYQINKAGEVKLFNVSTSWDSVAGLYEIVLVDNGFYQPVQLYKTVTKDENWVSGDKNTTQEFRDKEGHVVLKRTFNDDIYDTYYVYDIYGNLTYVLPPIADPQKNTITRDVLDNLCYQYKYDNRNRLVEKRLPGKQWEFIVYDKLNRPIVTGPALNPFDGNNWGWIFTKYDAFGRVAYTGWFTGAYTRSNLQNANNGAVSIATRIDSTIDGVPVNYSNTNIPTNLILLTVNYYDDYKYPDAPSFVDVLDQPVLKHPTGLSTGSWVRVLTAGGTLQKETSYVFYDYDGRVVRTYRKNYIGGYTYVDSFLDFIGKTLYSVTKHKYSDDGEELVIREDFTYSLQDRLVNHTHQIKEDPLQLIAHNTYDELGQLINKKVGGLNVSGEEGLQTVDYSYNIRGWLTGINDFDTVNMENDLFAFKINYNKPEPEAPTAALFNGNISETLWKTSSDKILRKYEYSYDYLNRLLQADYKKPDNAHGTNNYLEQLSYDKSGNILTLHRNGDLDSDVHTNEIDDLIYSYHPDKKNQLMKVFDSSANPQGFKDDSNGINDSADDYNYDLNGNMIADTNKGISITYNHLNLPMLINFNANGGKINYIYDAVGTKLKKIVEVSGNPIEYYYINGFQYMKDKLLFFPHAEGYISYVSAVEGGVPESFNYVFNYTDHLGNIRLSYGVNPNFPSKTMIFEENNYYPFGLKHSNYNVYWVEKEDYKYKYNGFEYQDELGLNVYDYGARNYDPALGRWMNIDPLAETSRRWSPYAYCYNNPLRFTDPDGMQADDVIIKGEGADKTLAQLQKSTSLTLSMNSDGKVTATGEAKTAADKELQAATTDKNVTVNLNSTLGNQSTDGSGDYLSSSGSFDGSTVNADGTATANQTVNPDFAAAVDNFEGTPEGAGVLHETLEGYQEGKRAQETQTPSGPAIPGTPGYANYLKAHNKADAIDPRHIRVGEPDRGLRKDGTLWQGLFKPSGDFLPLYQVKK